VIFGALQVTKVLSTEEVKRAIEGPGKDFGKSRSDLEKRKNITQNLNTDFYTKTLKTPIH
jgi:hypothetical protein